MKAQNFTHPLRRARRGFTLTEVLIALALVVLVTSLAATAFDKLFGDTRETVVRQFVTHDLKTPLTVYRLNTGNYPSTEEGIRALVVQPTGKPGWKGPYLDTRGVPVDPWGVEYRYAFPGRHNPDRPDIWSIGPDRIDGTLDDIGNWEG